MLRRTLLPLLASLALAAGSSAALGQVGTAVTYQGQIKNAGQVVNSPTDFRFNVFDAPTGGAALGTTVTRIGVPVSGGVFTTTFDCGVNPYTADRALWLQIDVRNPSNTGGFVPLTTRQRLTAAPFSLATRGLSVDAGSNVGIGAPADPIAKLRVTGVAELGTVRLMDERDDADMTFDGGTDSVAGIRHIGAPSGVFSFSSPSVGDIFQIHNSGRVALPAHRPFDFGVGAPRADTNNGLVGYQLFSNGLDIVGAGPSFETRKLTLFGETTILGNTIIANAGNIGVGTDIPTHRLTTKNFADGNAIRMIGGIGIFEWGAIANWGDADFVHISEPEDDVMELKARLGINSVSAFSAPVKNFRIDHPADPANMILNHGCIESDQYVNLYRGNAVIGAGGSVWIQLPSWMQNLNADFSYQLTSVGAPQPGLYVAAKINNQNQFQVAGGVAGAEVSWQITGVRQDAYVRAHPLVVEEPKAPAKRGVYLNPDAFGVFTEAELAKRAVR